LGYDHLLDETVETLNWSQKDRIKAVWYDTFIPYPRSTYIISRFDELIERPRTLRPQNILCPGPAGNGKTALLQEFENRNPRKKNPAEIAILLSGIAGNGKSALLQECEMKYPSQVTRPIEIIPVIRTTAPVGGGEGRLLSAILQQFGYKDWDTGSIDNKQKRVLLSLWICHVRLIIVDDVNNMLHGGKKKSEALYAIRNISNYLQIPIVFAGSEEAKVVFRDEPSLTSRLELLELPLWVENEDFYKFLWDLESTLSLKRSSHLYKREKAHIIFELSKSLDPDGRPGILVNILKIVKTAAVNAILDGSEYVTIQHLRSAAESGTWNFS
jgi:hypothetical protein